MRRKMGSIMFVLLFVFFSSCSARKILNPYSESFGCKNGDFGDCSSVKTAYQKSLAESDENDEEKFSPLFTKNKEVVYPEHKSQENNGIADIENEMLKPKVATVRKYRVFIPGYVADNNIFYGRRNIYYIVDAPKWIIK